MLRVYGPPATQIFTLIPDKPTRKEISFHPYVTVVSTNWNEENGGEGDVEYPGYSKCALQNIFRLWQNEQ
jgi:hypothetical protein